MTALFSSRYSRLRELQGRVSLPLELAVHEDSVLAVALEEELVALVVDLDVSPRDEARVAEMDVNISSGAAVPADHYFALSH